MGALDEARLYLCTDAREGRGDLEDFLDAVLANGVDIVQLRQKGLEARAEMAYAEVFQDAARRHGALFAANDRADVARALGADVLHLGQDDLPAGVAREIVGPGMLLGLSTHTAAEAGAAAAAPGLDYFCVGPTWVTPTKPGRPAVGIALVRQVAARTPARPWFVTGGVDLTTLDDVLGAGGRRVVVVRALTEADDPGTAARELAARLRAPGG